MSGKKDALRAAVGASNKNIRGEKEDDDEVTAPKQGAVTGDPAAEVPIGGISDRIDKGERTLEFFRRGDSGRVIGVLGQQLVSDLKRLLTDTRAVVELVDDDDVIRDLLHHSFHLLRATITGKGYGPRMPVPAMIENWRMMVASLFTSADVLDMFSTGGFVVHTLHEADDFLVRLSEVVALVMELMLSIPSQQEGGLPAEEEQKWAGLRARTMEDLRVTWEALSKNRVWRSLHRRRRSAEASDARNLFTMWFDFLQNELTQVWIDATEYVCELLQRVVGDRANVDDALEAAFIFLESISQNTQLLELIYDLKDTLARLTHDLPRMGPPQIESQLLHFAVTLQHIKDEVTSDPMYGKAYEECSKLFAAVKSEPTAARLLKDTKKMWRRIRIARASQYYSFPPNKVQFSIDFIGKVEYTLDNLHVDITSIMPSNIHIRFECTMEHGGARYQAQRTFIYIEVRKIHVNLHNVEWKYERHAIPRFTDAGLVDINSTGDGMILRMKLELKEGLTHKRVLEPLAVRCYMDSIKLKFSGSKHNKLYNILTGLLSTKVKREMQKNFEQKVLQTTSDFNETVALLVTHLKARPTSPALRRTSVSRRASMSRRPSVLPSPLTSPQSSLPSPLSTLQPDYRRSSILPPLASYVPATRNLELPSISKLPLPTRRGTPAPPTPPLRSTYPPIMESPPSPPLVSRSPPQLAASEPIQPAPRPRPTSLPAPLTPPSAEEAALTAQRVRFQEENGYPPREEPKKDGSKPLVSILKKNAHNTRTTHHLSPIPEDDPPPAEAPFAGMDYAVYKYLQTQASNNPRGGSLPGQM